MSSRNVDTIRAAHESWNRRDYDGLIRNMADNLVWNDKPNDLALSGKHKFREWTEKWARAFSDGKIKNAQYLDAGDTVIAMFTVEGTNDGPYAGFAPTGRRVTCSFCDITHFDANGRIVSGNCYYDQYTILTQLGHVQPLAAAA